MATDMIAQAMAMDAAQQQGGDAYTKAQTDALLDDKADLVDGKVPASQLPSYVDDVLEYNSTSAFPATGESGKIYVASDTNRTYRWGGSAYVEISESLALGETASTAYPGNKGKANADAIAAIKDGTNIDSFADVETVLAEKLNVSDVDTDLSSTSTNPVQNKAVQAPIAELYEIKADKSIVGLKLVASNTMASSSTYTYAMNKNDFIDSSPDLGRSIGTYIISIMPWSTNPTYSLYAVSYTGGSFGYTTITKIAGTDMSITVANGVISVSGLPSAGGKISIHALQ